MREKHISYTHRHDSLYLCDMRPGFSDGGVECALPPGLYRLGLAEGEANGGRGFSLLIKDASPDSRVDAGSIDVDGARIGIFNRQAFMQHYDYDFEELFEWSDAASGDAFGGAIDGAIEISPDDSANLTALVIDVQCDAVYRIHVLKSGSSVIGIEVAPVEQQASQKISRQYTRIDVKFTGVGEPWCYFDDWNFEPSQSDVIDSLILDLSIDLELSAQGRAAPEKIRPNTKIRDVLPRSRGVQEINAFLERNQRRARRIPLPDSLTSSSISAEATLEQLGEFVYSILLYARR